MFSMVVGLFPQFRGLVAVERVSGGDGGRGWQVLMGLPELKKGMYAGCEHALTLSL